MKFSEWLQLFCIGQISIQTQRFVNTQSLDMHDNFLLLLFEILTFISGMNVEKVIPDFIVFKKVNVLR